MNYNTPTLASSSMLVDLTLKGYTGKVRDKQVSQEIAGAKQARTRAGSYEKSLFSGCRELASILAYDVSIRQWHAAKTLPWSDRGPRLLPTAGYFDYLKELRDHQNHREILVAEFEKEYANIIQSAQFELGDMFNVEDYPEVSDIKDKFVMSYSIYPLPESGDFRVDIGNEGLDELRSQFDKAQEQRLAATVQDIRDRAKDAIEKLSHQLRDGGRIYDSAIESCIELVDVLRDLNLTKDEGIEQLRRELKNTVSYADAKELRKDEGARTQVKKELDNLLEKFSL